MKKSIIYIVMVLVLTLNVLAISAGKTTEIYKFDNLDSLRVNVEGQYNIETGEYKLIDCVETENNSWYCDNLNNNILMLQTNYTTINNYTFYMYYNYSETHQETKTASSGGGGSYTPKTTLNKSISFFVFDNKKRTFYVSKDKYLINLLSKNENSSKLRIGLDDFVIYLNQKKVISLENNQTISIVLNKVGNNYVKITVMKIIEESNNNTEVIIDLDVSEEAKDLLIKQDTELETTTTIKFIPTSTTTTTTNTIKNVNKDSNINYLPILIIISFFSISSSILIIYLIKYKKLGEKK